MQFGIPSDPDSFATSLLLPMCCSHFVSYSVLDRIALPHWSSTTTSAFGPAIQTPLSPLLRVSTFRCATTSCSPRGYPGVSAMANEESPLAAQMAVMALKPKNTEKPLFSFGVITDIQYADIDDGKSFLGVPRYYRHALLGLQRAVQSWNSKGDLSFAIHFGDIVDGYCPKEHSRAAFNTVTDEFANFKNGNVYHMIGNHCLYNLPREDLNSILNIPTSTELQQSYYSFSPHPRFLFVVLDGYDVSALGWPQDHPHTKTANEILNTRNPNEEKNSPEGLEGVERRFVKFNGGVGEEQLQWLERSLQEAANKNQKVVLCCHLPLDPGATFPSTLLWNYDEVMAVVHKFTCVVACIAGHAHDGGHSVDKHGVHHHVLEAVLECPPGSDAYGYVDVYPDRLYLCGTDRMASADMVF